MLKHTLEAVGLRTDRDIPAGEIFLKGFNPVKYGVPEDDMRMISALRDFVSEYNREVPADTSVTIRDSDTAAELMYPAMRGLDHEEVWTVFLNSVNRVISRHRICEGCLDSVALDHRKIIRTALEENATGVILYHSHPSGDSRPSVRDIKETARLRDELGVFDMKLIDHLVMADTEYYSFADEDVSGFGKRTGCTSGNPSLACF